MPIGRPIIGALYFVIAVLPTAVRKNVSHGVLLISAPRMSHILNRVLLVGSELLTGGTGPFEAEIHRICHDCLSLL